MIEKEKVLSIVKKLIESDLSKFDVKYLKSHEKVAILYKDHVVEIIGGDEKFIIYLNLKIPLKNREHKELHKKFMEQYKKRKENITLNKFTLLEKSIDEEDCSETQINIPDPETEDNIPDTEK